MYFFQSSPVSYKRFIKRFPTENSLIKLYAKTCVDFDIESKPKKRRCPHCGSCQNGPFRKNNYAYVKDAEGLSLYSEIASSTNPRPISEFGCI